MSFTMRQYRDVSYHRLCTYQFMALAVRSAPFTAGKHSAGAMISHHEHATALRGFDNRPSFHGPG